jgi:pimeloyl-ACP methyl ester carboxylesterase
LFLEQSRTIAAPTYESFTSRFGHAFPKPQYLKSDLGTTALYDLPPPSGRSKRNVLIVHGLNTPALGMLSLAQELQTLDRNAHIVLFDLWGHGLSSTPLVAHTPQIFHFQILQVLNFMRWTSAHIVGYSFGGSTAVSFALHHPQAVLSSAILAPAGLLKKEGFSKRMQELLDDSKGKDNEAIDCVLGFLEGGPLVVPVDWKERSERGEVVAQALREWELQEHQGFKRSALSMFRDGGVYGCEDRFAEYARQPFQKLALLAELDTVCSKGQLISLGFDDVKVVEGVDHDFVRSASRTVASSVCQFWTQLAR